MGEIDQRGDVQQNLLLLTLCVKRIERTIRPKASIIDQDINAQTTLLCLLEHGVRSPYTTQIGRNDISTNCILVLQLTGKDTQFLLGTCDKNKMGACGCQRLRECRTNTRRGTRNERGFPLIKIHDNFSFSER